MCYKLACQLTWMNQHAVPITCGAQKNVKLDRNGKKMLLTIITRFNQSSKSSYKRLSDGLDRVRTSTTNRSDPVKQWYHMMVANINLKTIRCLISRISQYMHPNHQSRGNLHIKYEKRIFIRCKQAAAAEQVSKRQPCASTGG